MPYEKGGRADKQGNRYEINCIIYEMIKVLDEKNYSVIVEPLGEDEAGTDILVTNFEGQREHQQCKARNASKEYWDFYELKSKNIISSWKIQLERDSFRKVALVSPIVCSFLVDLNNRACNTSEEAEGFYSMQIESSSKKFQNFYKNFCVEMGLNIGDKKDILRSVNYLKRISCKQMSEYQLEESINQSIDYLFISRRKIVYDAFLSFITMEDIFGREITQSVLYDYFSKNGITFRLRDGDERIMPRIVEINRVYRDNFKSLQGNLVHRKEFDDCIEAIEKEKSIIISGNAGYGKSGCTEAILDYCEKKQIPHIAIKLDRRIPSKNCEAWGKDLGFPSSIVYSIHCISKNKNAVIILDQLDALRWTQANSSEALAVCMELIRQVEHLNREREKKIILIFVCRIYDLENDNNIKSLFKKEEETKNGWEIVRVDAFEDRMVKEIVGDDYENLSSKLKGLLKIPSNLYIWEHLDKGVYGDCLTTRHLIDKWVEQICKKAVKEGIQERIVLETLKSIIDALDKSGRVYVSRDIVDIEKAGLDYLISSQIIIVSNAKVGFVHQSIVDYFISKNMFKKYYNGETIEKIIGEKNKQNPARRYQVQMFLQNVLEYDSNDFIRVGKSILNSEDIRYYVKYIFYEILGQIWQPDDNIIQFIVRNCENKIYGDYLLNAVIFGRKQYITVLRKYGILERWYSDPERKTIVFNLLQSISPNLDGGDIAFIQSHAFNNESDDEQFMRCFFHDILQESEEMFELRMMFYEQYPDYAKEVYIDVQTMMRRFEKRTIRLISFWLKNKIKSKGEYIYLYEGELLDRDNDFLIDNEEFVLNSLIPYIPEEIGNEVKYCDWSGRVSYHQTIERVCVELVKKATIVLIDKSPNGFWRYYKQYMGKGYHIFNEIILTGLSHLDSQYSNQIIQYLATDLNKNVFDYTSGAEDELGIASEIITIHGETCDEEKLSLIENVICRYISPHASRWCKQRIEQNRQKEYSPVYWSFWGDLQYKLLSCLPQEKISRESKELLRVLDRKFCKVPLRYSNSNGHSGFVKSPVSDKNISKAQWLQIITNKKLKNRNRSEWIEVKGGFVESSYITFAEDFRLVVKQYPQEMIELVLENADSVLPVFADALFVGVATSDELKKVDLEVIQRLLTEYPIDMDSDNAIYCCEIIEKIDDVEWAPEITDLLICIALNHKNPGIDEFNIISQKDKKIESCEKLLCNALNCARGCAARAIGRLLWENNELFFRFKDTIEKMVKDENVAVRFATLYALWPSYSIDKEWTEKKILHLYESDIRMASFPDSKNMFFRLYPKYKEKIIEIIEKCFESEDEKLVKTGGHAVCEFYILYDEFESIMSFLGLKSKKQIESIVEMAILYLKFKDYRETAKEIILSCQSIDVEFILSRMFDGEYIDLESDSEFLLELMRSKISRRMVRNFINYLEENAISIVGYADIILQLCGDILQMKLEDLRKEWRIDDEVSKLLISLYDETANSEERKRKQVAYKCMELWDIMFEKQLGSVIEISRKLMER